MTVSLPKPGVKLVSSQLKESSRSSSRYSRPVLTLKTQRTRTTKKMVVPNPTRRTSLRRKRRSTFLPKP